VTAVAGTVFIAAGAFWLSFTALKLRRDAITRLSRLQEPSDRRRQAGQPRRKLSRSQRKRKR
jgi:hypothetical protein